MAIPVNDKLVTVESLKAGLDTKANATDVYEKTETYTKTEVDDAIQQSTATLNTIEEHQITKIGNYINERTSFRSRRVGGTVIILSYVQVTTKIPTNTDFANIGISNAEGIFAFVSAHMAHIVPCSGGVLRPDEELPTGYYYVVGSALAPHT